MELDNLITGTGAVAQQNDTVELQYVLATYSTRKVVQSSWTSSPFTTPLTDSSVIPGFFDGVVGMRVGGRRELVIPPSRWATATRLRAPASPRTTPSYLSSTY